MPERANFPAAAGDFPDSRGNAGVQEFAPTLELRFPYETFGMQLLCVITDLQAARDYTLIARKQDAAER
jgi:hypothetical protein